MENSTVLDFENFIKKFYPMYIFDAANTGVIRQLSLWAARSPKFENENKGLYLDKGILIYGVVGTGKTDMFNLLRIYLNQYLRSRYTFQYNVAWELAGAFSKEGYDALKGHELHNRYYDELCMVDNRTKTPNKEYAQHFGNKMLIGEEIIMVRYNAFKQNGYQTHFSTNATPHQLAEIYGERANSRLNEMCNFLDLPGVDRREVGRPNIYRNINEPAPPKPRGLEGDYSNEAKPTMEEQYALYLADNPFTMPGAIIYTILCSLGVNVATDEELRVMMESCEKSLGNGDMLIRSASDRAKDKKEKAWKEVRDIAVKVFFGRLKNMGSKSIFGEREVASDSIATSIAGKK